MTDWIAWVCMGAAFVSAAYLIYVILKPERF